MCESARLRVLLLVLAVFSDFLTLESAALADVTDWRTGETIPGTETVVPGPAISLRGMDLSYADFRDTDLTQSGFSASRLDNATFAGADLTQVVFGEAYLNSTDFSDAILRNTFFVRNTDRGFTAEQLYSTLSYQEGSLIGLTLWGNDLTEWSFVGQDLTDASFLNTVLTDARFDGATVSGVAFATSGLRSEQLYSTQSYQDRELPRIDLHGLDLSSWDLTSQNMTSANLEGANLSSADLSNANLKDANLHRVNFDGATLHGANLADTRLTSAQFVQVDLTQVNLDTARLESSRFLDSDLTGVAFKNANLYHSVFTNVSLVNADFTGANLQNARFNNADFTNATIESTDLSFVSGLTEERFYSTQSYQDKSLFGIHLAFNDHAGWNFAAQDMRDGILQAGNFTNASFVGADLRGTDLTRSNLTNADLSQADLRGADLNDARYRDAIFADARIDGASLDAGFTKEQLYSTRSYQDANLRGIRLTANPRGWDLSGQDLTDSYLAFDMTGANLRDSNLTNAFLARVRLVDVDFSGSTISGTSLRNVTSVGFVESQLKSTASYQSGAVLRVDLSQNDLAGWDFSGINLSGGRFDFSNLEGSDFSGANLSNVSFADAKLAGSNLEDAIISSAYFRSTDGFAVEQLYSTGSYKNHDLRGVNFDGQNFTNADLSGQDLTGAVFNDTDLNGADLTDATVSYAQFYLGNQAGLTKEQLYSTRSYRQKDLRGLRLEGRGETGWDFSGQDLRESLLSGVGDASFQDATVDHARLLMTREQLYSTRSYLNENLRGIDQSRLDISQWDLSGIDLRGANFYSSILRDVDFGGAIVTGVDFGRTALSNRNALTPKQLYATQSYQIRDLRGTSFNRNTMVDWDFSEQDLTGANFTESVLAGSLFVRANLTDVDFSDARLDRADMTGALFSNSQIVATFLQDTVLAEAQLINVAFNRSLFDRTDLTGARLVNVDLSDVLNLTGAVLATASYNQWTQFPEGFDPRAAGMVFVESRSGDFNGDDRIDASDLIWLDAHLSRLANDPEATLPNSQRLMLDLNDDRYVDSADAIVWIRDKKQTWIGDANLDGQFNSSDLVAVFRENQYEDQLNDNSNWFTGDWNFDGEFGSDDLVLAFREGGYERGQREVQPVPEPSNFGAAMLFLVLVSPSWRRAMRSSKRPFYDVA